MPTVPGGPRRIWGGTSSTNWKQRAESLAEWRCGVSARRFGVGSLERADSLAAVAAGGPECNTSCPFPSSRPDRSLNGMERDRGLGRGGCPPGTGPASPALSGVPRTAASLGPGQTASVRLGNFRNVRTVERPSIRATPCRRRRPIRANAGRHHECTDRRHFQRRPTLLRADSDAQRVAAEGGGTGTVPWLGSERLRTGACGVRRVDSGPVTKGTAPSRRRQAPIRRRCTPRRCGPGGPVRPGPARRGSFRG